MEELLLVWAGLAGLAALITFVINVLKKAGVVKDGQAQTWSAGLNLLGLATVLAVQTYFPDTNLVNADAEVAKFVEVGTVVFSYVVQLLASKATHKAVKNVPLVGKSYSE